MVPRDIRRKSALEEWCLVVEHSEDEGGGGIHTS